ncbi:MAG: DUF6093 family protein [Actinomycetes bacterium]
MSATSATLAGRKAAERLMVDTCTVLRPGDRGAYDPTTLTYASNPTPLYDGKCRVKPTNTADRVVEFGGEPVSLFPYVVSLPIGDLVVHVDDVVTVTASALDPALVGLKLRVRDIASGTHLTARRLGCERNAG